VCGAEVGGGGLGDAPGLKVELLRRLAVAEVRWNGGSMAA